MLHIIVFITVVCALFNIGAHFEYSAPLFNNIFLSVLAHIGVAAIHYFQFFLNVFKSSQMAHS